MSKKWWEERREEEAEFRAEVSYRAWRAGLGADQNYDHMSRAFWDGQHPEDYVRGLERERDQARAEQARQEEEWARQVEAEEWVRQAEEEEWARQNEEEP